MFCVFSKYPLKPGLTRDVALEEIKETLNWYKGKEGLIRKYIALNWEGMYGYGVYLWSDKDAAEAFYAHARKVIKEQTGGEPEIIFFDTPFVVDNKEGLVYQDGEVIEDFTPAAAA